MLPHFRKMISLAIAHSVVKELNWILLLRPTSIGIILFDDQNDLWLAISLSQSHMLTAAALRVEFSYNFERSEITFSRWKTESCFSDKS